MCIGRGECLHPNACGHRPASSMDQSNHSLIFDLTHLQRTSSASLYPHPSYDEITIHSWVKVAWQLSPETMIIIESDGNTTEPWTNQNASIKESQEKTIWKNKKKRYERIRKNVMKESEGKNESHIFKTHGYYEWARGQIYDTRLYFLIRCMSTVEWWVDMT